MLWSLLLACATEAPPPSPDRDAAPVAEAAPEPAQRTVLLVTLDTTRADRLGAWGHAGARTPHLDALAARGTRYSRAYAPVPLTIPSHSTLFTGLLPPRHGVRDNGDLRLPPEALTLAERLQAEGWRTHAAVAAFVTQRHWGFGQGFDGYDDDLGIPSDRLSWRGERRAEPVVDDAIAALDAGAEFLWVHLFDAHAPYDPPPPFAAEFAKRPYDGELAYLDQQLGRLLAKLPEDALVVVAGDHGEGFGEGGEEAHGLLLTEGVLHVPLIVAGPGVPAGVDDRVVGLVDVAPTILGRLDVAYDPAGMDGQDLFADTSVRTGAYAETYYGARHFGWTPLHALTAPTGRLVRGARDEIEGTITDAARAELDRVVALPPSFAGDAATLDLTEVEQLQALGYVGTVAAAPTADALDPRDGIALTKKLAAIGRKSPAEQEQALRALLVEAPTMRDARIRLGLMLARSARLEEGIAEIARAYDGAPDSTGALMMGQLWMQAGDPAEALGWYREALEHDPRSSSARAGEVQALVRLGRIEEAAAAAEIALQAAPDHADLLLARAELALAQGEPPDPWLEPVTTLASERPFMPRGLHVAASLHRAAGDLLRAEELLKDELRWRPANLLARLDLLDLYRETGRHVDAVKTLRPLLDLQPEERRWQALAAREYLAMGRDDLARPHRAACKGDPACP